MQIRSTLPGPFVLEVSATDDAHFLVETADAVWDLTAHLANLAVLGFALGAEDGDGVISTGGVHGAIHPDATCQAAWQLVGELTGALLTDDGVQIVDRDQLGAWAALGVLRTISDAPAPR